jgi:hypothetical protein
MAQKLSFDEWMKAIDGIFFDRFGLSHDDLPDVCYGDMYDDGKSPKGAAAVAVRYAKGSGELC